MKTQMVLTENDLKNNGFIFGEHDEFFFDDPEIWYIDKPDFKIYISFPKNLDLMDEVDEKSKPDDIDPYGDAGIASGQVLIEFKGKIPFHYSAFFWEEGLTRNPFDEASKFYKGKCESYKDFVKLLFK